MASPTPAIQKRKTYTAAEKKVNSKQLSSFIGEVLGVNDAKDIINKARKGDIGGALKSTVVAAAMFTPGGKVLKGARLAAKAIEAEKAAKAAKVTSVVVKNLRKAKAGVGTTKKVSSADATAIAKELKVRPSDSGRVKDVKKPSLKSLSPHEKLYEKLGEKAKVTVVKKKPMSSAELKKSTATERKAKFTKVLTPIKPIGEKRAGSVTSLRPKVATLPKHKVDVKIMEKRKWKPDTSNAGAEADRTTRAVGKGEKGAYVRQPYKSKAEIREEGNNANNPQNTFAVKPKSNIAEGRGNTQQPHSVTKNPIERGNAMQKKEQRMEKRKARQANLRDARTDARESESTPRMVEHNWGSKLVKKPLIKTNHPKNAASDAGNMREKIKEIDAATAARTKKRELYKGNNKVSPELKAKVDKTLGTAKKNATERKLQNVFNKPVIKLPAKGRLTVTRPIKPVKK